MLSNKVEEAVKDLMTIFSARTRAVCHTTRAVSDNTQISHKALCRSHLFGDCYHNRQQSDSP